MRTLGTKQMLNNKGMIKRRQKNKSGSQNPLALRQY